MLAPQKESIFGRSCRLWLLSWRRARVFARSCSLLSKYLPISWKQRKEQSHAQCHVTHRIRIFDKLSEHVKVAKSVDIAVPELAVTHYNSRVSLHEAPTKKHVSKQIQRYEIHNALNRQSVILGVVFGTLLAEHWFQSASIPRFSIFAICADLQGFCADMYKFEKNDLLRNTIKTPQRCQTNNQNVQNWCEISLMSK